MSEYGTNFIPITEAALQLDILENEILMLIESDKLHGKMIDGSWYVDQTSLNLYDKSKGEVEAVGCGICGSACGNGC